MAKSIFCDIMHTQNHRKRTKNVYKSQFNIICAGVLLTLLPPLIAFLLFQKQVYAGLASGSVKG